MWTLYIVPVMSVFLRGDRLRPRRAANAAAQPSSVRRRCRSARGGPVAAGCRARGGGRRRAAPRAGAVGVTAGDSTCETTHSHVAAGNRTFSVKNTGSQITEVYVYGTGDRVMGEVENIGPSTGRDLVVQLPPGALRGGVQAGHDRQGHPPAADRHRPGRRAARRARSCRPPSTATAAS